jgi:hypothetical protein
MSNLRIQGATNLTGISSNNELQIAHTATSANAGYVKMACIDGMALTSADGKLSVAKETVIFTDAMPYFDNATTNTVNYLNWYTLSATATIGYNNGIILNTGSSVAVNVHCGVFSHRQFSIIPGGYLCLKARVMTNWGAIPAKDLHLGFCDQASGNEPYDSVGFIWDRNGDFKAQVSFGNVIPTRINSPLLTRPSDDQYHTYDIMVSQSDAYFFIDELLVATLRPPANTPQWVKPKMSVFAQYAAWPSATSIPPHRDARLLLGNVNVSYRGYTLHRPATLLHTASSRDLISLPTTAYTQLSNHVNSTSPTSATLSNTAAGYTTLGGRWQFAAVGSAATDFHIFATQLLSSAVEDGNWKSFITGVRISAVNTVIAVATTATVLDWSLGIYSTQVSLATADTLTSNTIMVRRIPLGVQAWAVADAIGKQAQDIEVVFPTPLYVPNHCFISIIVQCPVGTATGTEIFRGDVAITGWIE